MRNIYSNQYFSRTSPGEDIGNGIGIGFDSMGEGAEGAGIGWARGGGSGTKGAGVGCGMGFGIGMNGDGVGCGTGVSSGTKG